jgi:hypothetical protein
MTPKRTNSTEGLQPGVASAWFSGRNAAFSALISRGAGRSLAEDLASEACTEAFAMGKLGETALVRTIAVTTLIDRVRHDSAARRFSRLQRAVNNSVSVLDSDRKAELALVREALKELQRDLDVRIVVDCLKRGITPTQAAIDFAMSPSNARRRFVIGLTKIRSRVELRVCSRDSGDSVDKRKL